jgi:hypothetical protein
MSEPRDIVVDAINAGRFLIRKDRTDIARVTDREFIAAIAEVKHRAEAYTKLLNISAELAGKVTIEWSDRACTLVEEINAIDRAVFDAVRAAKGGGDE